MHPVAVVLISWSTATTTRINTTTATDLILLLLLLVVWSSHLPGQWTETRTCCGFQATKSGKYCPRSAVKNRKLSMWMARLNMADWTPKYTNKQTQTTVSDYYLLLLPYMQATPPQCWPLIRRTRTWRSSFGGQRSFSSDNNKSTLEAKAEEVGWADCRMANFIHTRIPISGSTAT